MNSRTLCAFCLLPSGHTGSHQVQRPAELDRLDAAIATRTGGKRLGEMTGDELREAFSSGPIHFRNGEVVDE